MALYLGTIFSVTPAKAGVQWLSKNWIPACARMTRRGNTKGKIK